MADFRVTLGISDDVESELDWDRHENCWTLSEREVGLGQRWFEGIMATPEQLSALLRFFKIENASLSPEVVRRMSPGELAAVHAGLGRHGVYAVLCGKCGEHWYVYRWEEDEKRWAVYGRTCEFSWRRGDSPQGRDIEILGRVRRDGVEDPLVPPA